MFGTALSLTPHTGTAALYLSLAPQQALEVAALAPRAPQAGIALLDAALEVGLATQAGLLLALPVCFQLSAALWQAWGNLPGAEHALYAQLQLSGLLSLRAYETLLPVVGMAGHSIFMSLDRGTWVLESIDVWLVLAELWGVSWGIAIAARLGVSRLRGQTGYDDIVTLFQHRGISAAEVLSLTTAALGLCAFDVFVTLAEDDVLEAISYVFGCVIGLAVLLLFLAIDLQYYYMVSAISGGEATARLLYTDVVNNGLCLLRVFFCWVRYLFYDLQAELVDFAFHYTETAEEQALESAVSFVASSAGDAGIGWAWLAALVNGGLLIFLDAVAVLLQLLIGGFKLALALFLFWLILDLFLLRTAARAEALGLLNRARRAKR